MLEPLTISVCGSDWEISVHARNQGVIEVDMHVVLSASRSEDWPFPLLTPQEARELAKRLEDAANKADWL